MNRTLVIIISIQLIACAPISVVRRPVLTEIPIAMTKGLPCSGGVINVDGSVCGVWMSKELAAQKAGNFEEWRKGYVGCQDKLSQCEGGLLTLNQALWLGSVVLATGAVAGGAIVYSLKP